MRRMITMENCAVTYDDQDPNSGIVIEDYKTAAMIKISSDEIINLSQRFWKVWAIAKVKSETGGYVAPNIKQTISELARNFKYW